MTDKEIQELHCEIAELMGWKHLWTCSGPDGVPYFLGNDGKGNIARKVPNYTGDMNILLGEFADWLRANELKITIEQNGIRYWSVEIYELYDSECMGGGLNLTPQQAAYHAIKQALPKIKEIVHG